MNPKHMKLLLTGIELLFTQINLLGDPPGYCPISAGFQIKSDGVRP